MSLEHLPSATRAKLRSAQLLTSVPQAVSELLQNALDAGARNVEVGVDAANWECWVRDDGEGISRDGLASISSGRYHTNKAYEPASLDEISTFGFRGEALASAADISCMEIVSRTARSRECRTIIMKNGKCLYDGPSSRWRRERHGTVVCLRDMFYNLPIRRTSHPAPAKTLELIRKEIETYAVVFPEVSFNLEDTSRGEDDSSGVARLLSVPKTASILTAFRTIYGRALTERVQELDETLENIVVSGFISLNGALSKSHQYIYVNRHPMAPNHLHHAVNSEFLRSTFGRHDLTDENDMPSPSQTAYRRSPRKSERKPVYVLNISLPSSEIDNCIEPAKTAVHLLNDGTVVDFLISIVRAFLHRHGFAFNQTESSPTPTSSPRKRRRLDRTPSPLKRPTSSCFERDALPEPLYVYPTRNDDRTTEDKVPWRDPSTGVRYFIDPRTGNSYPADEVRRNDDEDLEERARLRRRTLAPENARGSTTDNETPTWLTDALKSNVAYKLPERNITAVPPATQPQSQASKPSFHSCETHAHALDMKSTTFERIDLTHARVLAQVDRKFVLLALGDGAGSTLALLDQHAASERVRVERFLGELCEGKHVPLNASVPVLLAPNEARVVREAHESLARWGLVLEPQPDGDSNATKPDIHEQVLVSAVPDVVSRKLLMPGELSALLKSVVADLESGELSPPSASQAQPRDEAFAWKRALRYCPRGLIDLVNSRACRGAIMFNDPLTPTQCERLVAQLAETAFPFQCAHGRPALAPLARLGDATSRKQLSEGKIDWARLVQTGYVNK